MHSNYASISEMRLMRLATLLRSLIPFAVGHSHYLYLSSSIIWLFHLLFGDFLFVVKSAQSGWIAWVMVIFYGRSIKTSSV